MNTFHVDMRGADADALRRLEQLVGEVSGRIESAAANQVTLAPISLADARAYFEKHSAYRGEFNLAISAADESGVHGVIAMRADGAEFSLGHISTDGNAQIGSLLYGGMVRVAKALGYRTVTI